MYLYCFSSFSIKFLFIKKKKKKTYGERDSNLSSPYKEDRAMPPSYKAFGYILLFFSISKNFY